MHDEYKLKCINTEYFANIRQFLRRLYYYNIQIIFLQTGPEVHPVSYKMGTGSFSGVKRLRRGVDLPPASSAEVKEII
jgi:hypothetical protein